MKEISYRIIQILKENNIFIESDGLIENYFISFENVIQNSKFNLLNLFIGNYIIKYNVTKKDYINNKLNELRKPGYLIIDDLDRCSEEYQEKAYKVLRESTNLDNCKTIFLVDKDQLKVNDINYLDKYTSYTLDLCEIEYKEIIEYFISEILSDDFFDNINNIINKNKNEIKDMILNLTDNILEKLKNEMENHSENDDNTPENKKSGYDQILSLITNNTKNIRKVKKFLKSIKYSIHNINLEIDNVSSEYQKKDWIGYILRVQFLKTFLPEYYIDIKKYIDIEDFINKNNNYYICCVLNIDKLVKYRTDSVILNELLYREDVIDYSKIKTSREKYLNELRSNAKIQNINNYIDYFETCDDLLRILKICEKQGKNNFEGREEFIKKLIKNLSKQSLVYNLDISELFNISKQIIEWLSIIKLTNIEKNIIQNYSKLIIRRVIVDTDKEENYKSSSISSVVKKLDLDDYMDVDLDNDNKIRIQLGDEMYQYFAQLQGQDKLPVIHSMIVLPVLVYVIDQIKDYSLRETYEDYYWYRCIAKQLEILNIGIDSQFFESKSSVYIAQELLKAPIKNALYNLTSVEGED